MACIAMAFITRGNTRVPIWLIRIMGLTTPLPDITRPHIRDRVIISSRDITVRTARLQARAIKGQVIKGPGIKGPDILGKSIKGHNIRSNMIRHPDPGMPAFSRRLNEAPACKGMIFMLRVIMLQPMLRLIMLRAIMHRAIMLPAIICRSIRRLMDQSHGRSLHQLVLPCMIRPMLIRLHRGMTIPGRQCRDRPCPITKARFSRSRRNRS